MIIIGCERTVSVCRCDVLVCRVCVVLYSSMVEFPASTHARKTPQSETLAILSCIIHLIDIERDYSSM